MERDSKSLAAREPSGRARSWSPRFGHKTVQQWEVLAVSMTSDRPRVVPQSEYDGGEAMWAKLEDIVTVSPPGGRCACSACDAMAAKTKLLRVGAIFNSFRWREPSWPSVGRLVTRRGQVQGRRPRLVSESMVPFFVFK